VPQLADAPEVFEALARLSPRPVISALVPNVHGMDAALRVNELAYGETGRIVIDKIAVFTAASETFARKNTNATIAETIDRFRPVVALARRHALLVRAYVSCVIACPFEGPTEPAAVARVVDMLADLGVDEIDLGDTIGAGEPESVRAMLAAARAAPGASNPHLAWTLHLHDTFGRAVECVRTALDAGMRSFDGAAGGLGGCPYAGTPDRRAPGNISTENLVRAVHDAGYDTLVDRDALARAGEIAREIVGPRAEGAGR
jgi:hydroxymethylglutaryl-CoA lyase